MRSSSKTPDHEKEFGDFEIDHIYYILNVYRSRILDLKNDFRFRYILIFKNHGSAAGASLEHSHSQLIATPILPKRVIEELEGAKKHYELKERCIFCDIIHQELDNPRRVVFYNEEYLAIAPFASRFPYETWILPRRHYSHFERMDEMMYRRLAEVMKEIFQKFARVLNSPPYNFILHSTPLQQAETPEYHWHIEIIPKLTRIAGFEWGSGFYINPVPPEEAAFQLREEP